LTGSVKDRTVRGFGELDLDDRVEGWRDHGSGHDPDAVRIGSISIPCATRIDRSNDPVRYFDLFPRPDDRKPIHGRAGERGNVPVREYVPGEDLPWHARKGNGMGLHGTNDGKDGGERLFVGDDHGLESPPAGTGRSTFHYCMRKGSEMENLLIVGYLFNFLP
jgi:hypothetical protein